MNLLVNVTAEIRNQLVVVRSINRFPEKEENIWTTAEEWQTHSWFGPLRTLEYCLEGNSG